MQNGDAFQKNISRHYGRDGIAAAILAAVGQDRPSAAALSAFDEFHIGGRAATEYLARRLEFQAGQHVLDVGCGVGGAARFFAASCQAHVTGIDLTESYIAAAQVLSAATGLSESGEFMAADAVALPFANEAFDGAYTIHTAMNIADKAALYQGIRRVLKRGAMFGVYDILRGENPAALEFPLPWASTPEMSFLETPEEVQGLLQHAGFDILETESRRDFALKALNNTLLRTLDSPARIVMGDNFAEKISNLIKAVENERCVPWQIICRAAAKIS